MANFIDFVNERIDEKFFSETPFRCLLASGMGVLASPDDTPHIVACMSEQVESALESTRDVYGYPVRIKFQRILGGDWFWSDSGYDEDIYTQFVELTRNALNQEWKDTIERTGRLFGCKVGMAKVNFLVLRPAKKILDYDLDKYDRAIASTMLF